MLVGRVLVGRVLLGRVLVGRVLLGRVLLGRVLVWEKGGAVGHVLVLRLQCGGQGVHQLKHFLKVGGVGEF